MRTRGLLDLLGTNRSTLHRYALALDQRPRILPRQGHPYDWPPSACATLYTSWRLCETSSLHPAATAYPALAVGVAYRDLTPGVPLYAACTRESVYLADTPADVWHAAIPLAKTGLVVRIVSLVPLKEALMTTRPEPSPATPYVVTFGYTRRLVEAENANEARVLFEALVGWPVGSTIGRDEVVVRDATESDIEEFYPLRGRHRLLNEQATFDL